MRHETFQIPPGYFLFIRNAHLFCDILPVLRFSGRTLSLPRQRDLYRHEPAPGTALLPLSGSYARAFRTRPRKISDGRHHHPEPSYCGCRLVDSRIFIQKALPPQTGRLSSAHDAFWGVLPCRFGAGDALCTPPALNPRLWRFRCSYYFFRFLAAYVMEARSRLKNLCSAAIFCILLISIRKQMYAALLILLTVIFVEMLRSKCWKKGLLSLAVSALTILLAVTGLDLSYNTVLRGETVRHSGDSRFLLTMIFYTAERDYGEKIDDANIRKLFYDIYDTCDEAGYLKHSAPNGWLPRVNHFGDHYDHIQIDTLRPGVTDYVAVNEPGTETEMAARVDDIMQTMTGSLLLSCLPSMIGCFFDNVLSGLVTTVSCGLSCFQLPRSSCTQAISPFVRSASCVPNAAALRKTAFVQKRRPARRSYTSPCWSFFVSSSMWQ